MYGDNLYLEFEFGQNLPLPKLLHIFNVHVHCRKGEFSPNYMFLFTEGVFKKGGNTVFNFLMRVEVANRPRSVPWTGQRVVAF